MDKQKVLETIKKILAVADDDRGNEEQAKVAALKAQVLIAKYNISEDEITDVVEKQEKQKIIHCDVETPGNRNYRFQLAMVISENYKCKVYSVLRSGGKKKVWVLRFVGKQMDVEIAISIYNYLYSIIHELALKEYHKKRAAKMDLKNVMPSYAIGFCYGLDAALKKQGTELMIVTDDEVIKAFNDKVTGETKVGSKDVVNNHSFQKGYEEGKEYYDKKRIGEGVDE